jgi:hypothetical protein
MRQAIKFWKRLNKSAKDGVVIVDGLKDIPEFDSECFDSNIRSYHFIDSTFSDPFILETHQDINTRFEFINCNFNNSVKFDSFGYHFKQPITFKRVIYNADIAFVGKFDEKIEFSANKDVSSAVSTDIKKSKQPKLSFGIFGEIEDVYSQFSHIHIRGHINNILDISFIDCEVDTLSIKHFDYIEKIEFNGVTIGSELHIKNTTLNALIMFNMNFLEDSKMILFGIDVNKFHMKRLTQDVKYMQFRHIRVKNQFVSNTVEYRNSYFSYFDLQNATIHIDKVSFIDSSLNSIKWGKITKINASQEIFRQLKSIYDAQRDHIQANEFYSMEMRKYSEKVSIYQISEYIVFTFNKRISNFGQSWIRPLSIYLIAGIIFSQLMCHFFVCNGIDFSTLIVYAYNPVDKYIIQTYGLVGLIYKIFSGLILYHLVIAFRRQTRR